MKNDIPEINQDKKQAQDPELEVRVSQLSRLMKDERRDGALVFLKSLLKKDKKLREYFETVYTRIQSGNLDYQEFYGELVKFWDEIDEREVRDSNRATLYGLLKRNNYYRNYSGAIFGAMTKLTLEVLVNREPTDITLDDLMSTVGNSTPEQLIHRIGDEKYQKLQEEF